MIKIEVKSNAIVNRAGISKRTGKPFDMNEQRAWLHGAKDYPTEVSFVLGQGQVPFAPGWYVVGPECCQVDRFGNIVLRLQNMKPLASVKAA